MSKQETTELKGIAIMLMFWHHLFGCDGFVLPENAWIPMIRIPNNWGSLDRYFGSHAKLCIAIFAAASGYGLYKSYIQSVNAHIVKRVLKFIVTYWTILFVLVLPYMVVFGKFDIKEFLISLLCLLDTGYVSFSWYVKVYLMILMVLPLVKKLQKYITNIWLDLLLFVIFPLLFYHILPDNESSYTNIIIFLLSSLRILCVWYPEFHIGVIVAKYCLDAKIYDKIKKCLNNGTIIVTASIAMIGAIMLRTLYRDFALAFVFLISFYCFIKSVHIPLIHNGLNFVGKYSFQYWIISGLFFRNTTEFQWIIYLPRLSVLVFCWSFVVMVPMVVCTFALSNLVNNKLLNNVEKV